MLQNLFKYTRAAVLGLSVAAWGGAATAVPITVTGTTVSFTFDDALAGLFGTPGGAGNALIFTPTNFKAQAFNSAGIVAASQTFNVQVSANPGYLITAVKLSEAGDYYNLGSSSAVAVGGQLRVFDLETPLAPALTASIAASQPLTALTSFAAFATSDWNASANVTLPATGWSGADGAIGNVNVTIENILLAKSLVLGDAAFIEKKFAGLAIVTTPVPEPQAYLSFAVGLGLVGWMGWRRTDKV